VIVFVFDLAVMFGVQLARLGRVMIGVGRMAGGDVGMMASGFRIAGFVVRGGFAVMLSRFLVVVGSLAVVFVCVMGRGHGNILLGLVADRMDARRKTDDRFR
jgi:hypothetical protein